MGKFKRMFSGTEDLPIVEKRGYFNEYPHFERVIQNSVDDIINEVGEEARNNPYIPSRPSSSTWYSSKDNNFEDSIFGKMKSESVPKPLGSILTPEFQEKYKNLESFNKNGESVDRADVNRKLVEALVQQKLPTHYNNYKYNPQIEDTPGSIRNVASLMLDKDPTKTVTPKFKNMSEVLGLYEHDPDVISIKKDEDNISKATIFAHENRHREERGEKTSGIENPQDLSKEKITSDKIESINSPGFYTHLFPETPTVNSFIKNDRDKKDFRMKGEMGMLYDQLLKEAIKKGLVKSPEDDKEKRTYEKLKAYIQGDK